MKEVYYLDQDRQPVGPVPLEKLVRYYKEGKMSGRAKICPVGGKKWERLDDFLEDHMMENDRRPVFRGSSPWLTNIFSVRGDNPYGLIGIPTNHPLYFVVWLLLIGGLCYLFYAITMLQKVIEFGSFASAFGASVTGLYFKWFSIYLLPVLVDIAVIYFIRRSFSRK